MSWMFPGVLQPFEWDYIHYFEQMTKIVLSVFIGEGNDKINYFPFRCFKISNIEIPVSHFFGLGECFPYFPDRLVYTYFFAYHGILYFAVTYLNTKQLFPRKCLFILLQ